MPSGAMYIVVGVVILVALYFWFRGEKFHSEKEQLIREYEEKLRTLGENHRNELGKARKESVQISRNTLRGKVAEQVAPMLPGFDYSPSDARFLGDPIDYIIFDGYSKVRDGIGGEGELEVVILDIKSGKARLSKEQRKIAEAIDAGRVRFEVVRVSEDGEVEKHHWRRRKPRKEKKTKDALVEKKMKREKTQAENGNLKAHRVVVAVNYPREHLKWSNKENLYLEEKMRAGLGVGKIAQILKRSPASVKAHLEKQ